MDFEERERVYGRDEYYWGKEPSSLAKTTAEYLPADLKGTVIDIGSGEGPDSVFFAEQGFDVYAVDISPAGLEKQLDSQRNDASKSRPSKRISTSSSSPS